MEENKNEVNTENKVQPIDNNCNCGCKDKKCKKGTSALLLILVCIVGFALGFYVSYFVCGCNDKDKKPEKNVTESNKPEEKPEEKKDDNEITEEVKNEMINKVATLLGEKEYKKGTQIDANIAFGSVFNKFFNGKFTEEVKTILILASIDPDKDGNYSGEEFTKNYKNVYGVEPKYVSTGCPAQKYDKTKNMYVDGEGGCGGASSSSDLVYIDDVVKTNDTILSVQAYVGSTYSSIDNEGDYFTDYFKSEYYDDDYKLVASAPITKETKITEQNKTQFTKYNFNFEKSTDGNYYFKNVEKAK